MESKLRPSGLMVPPGAEPVTRQFICKLGHTYTAPEPFEIAVVMNGKVVYQTKTLCPICYGKWLDKSFPAQDVAKLPRDGTTEGPNRAERRRRKGGKA